ncbi:MAG: hypothetical protein EXR55_00755 [Dehalococcoidia bacterium]|nr:hypothetical protein [Dehalococcoidia bacterium]
MPIISAKDQEFLRQHLSRELKKKTKLTLFTQKAGGLTIPGRECRFCGETQQLLEELTSLSDKLELDVRDFYAEADAARELGVDRVPTILMGKDGQQNLRFMGIPRGNEFPTILEDLVSLSQDTNPLPPPIRRRVARIQKDIRIQVFVTPT